MVQSKNWYVHIGDEIFGPVPTEVINVMLRQTRLQFTDFIWATGLTKWVRIIDVDDFTRLLPPYPALSIPSSGPYSGSGSKASRNNDLAPKLEVTEEVLDFSHEEEVEEKEKKSKPQSKEEFRSGVVSGKPVKPGLKLSAFPRIKLKGKITIKGHGSFKVIDISEGGVFVASAEQFEIGTEVDFTLEAQAFGEPMAMTGVVIRHGDRHDEKGFAVEFLRLNPVYKRLLKDIISKESDGK